ncbi:uncharacterized protein LOC127836659 [Dreissena polymorpha]|uniref:uncharacterized protein LOC127836659 n=1 Tax=Dreissena polymorpha TaxID=45954 RepID=UPI002264E19C|nr:uncharacterized protein LOC127836659 [Dreissena polymorpha]
MPIPFDGCPFVQLGTEVRECHYGPNRKERKKAQPNDPEHAYAGGKRKIIQNTKKHGCCCQIRMKTILRFPDYKLEGTDTRRKRQAVIDRLKSAEVSSLRGEVCVLVAYVGTHEHHVMGEEAGYGQRLDKEILQKIKELAMKEGITNATEMKSHIALFVKSKYSHIPKSNRRFHPTMQDLRFHISSALKSNIHCYDDQGNLTALISEWKKESPSDNFHFRPSGISSEGVPQTLLFVHQSEFQRKMLMKYGSTVVMDSTYNTSKYNVCVFFMAVLTGTGYLPVGTFLLEKETAHEIKSALEVIKGWCPNWKPRSFVCDLDQREISAVEECFKGSHSLKVLQTAPSP